MIEVSTINNSGRRIVLATLATFDAAKAHVESLGVAFMEEDADYPNCADAYLNDGRVVAIQPVGFTATLPVNGDKAKAMADERAAALESLKEEFGI